MATALEDMGAIGKRQRAREVSWLERSGPARRR